MNSIVRLSPETAALNICSSGVRFFQPGDSLESLTGFLDPTQIEHEFAIFPDPNTLRPATQQELAAITATPETPPSAKIEVFRTNEMLAHLGKIALSSDKPAATEAYQLMKYFSISYMHAEPITINRTPGNCLTAVRNPKNGLLAGMHVDDRDRLPLETRIESRRRMAVVLGDKPSDPTPQDTRFLLAAFPDVLTMAHSMEIFTTSDLLKVTAQVGIYQKHFGNINTVVWEFLRRGGEVTCYWIPTAEMSWLAPTDILLHEASTYGQNGSTSFLFLQNWHDQEEFDRWVVSRA